MFSTLRLRLLISSPLLPVAAMSVGLAALTGCGMSTDQLAGPGQVQGAAITGVVHGGQQAVSGAQVYLFAASSAGYGQPAVNLLKTGAINVISGGTYGNYVLTGPTGGFNVSEDYTCTAGSQIYMLSLGGNPGLAAGTNNSAIALLAALGSCPSGGFGQSFHLVINEVTTVAAVYALSGYMTGAGGLSYPAETSNLALTGLTNAMLNAQQLASFAGTALAVTPGGNGQVPMAKINTLADIIASCVNTNGALTQTVGNSTTNTSCGNLFQYTTVGASVPSDTVSALLNIVHNPAVNVGNLFALVPPTSPPFQPTLGSTQPSDWTLSIAYGSNLQGVSATASAGVPAVDALGQVWFPTQVTLVQAGTTAYASVLQGLTPLGETISNVDILDGSTSALSDITVPYQAAIDANGNVWGAINSYGFVARYDPVNDAPYTFFYNPGSNDDGHQLAIGADSYVYVSDYTMGQTFKMNLNGELQTFASTPGTDYGVALTQPGNAVMGYSDAGGPTPDKIDETNSAGGTVTTPTNAALAAPIALPGNAVPNSFAADGNGKVWVTDGNNDLFAYTESTVNAAGSNISKYNGGGLQSNMAAWPVVWLAVDGGGNVWVPNYGSTAVPGNISEFNNNGTAITPSTGYIGSTACSPQGLAIDGSGDVWVSCSTSTQPVLEFIGAAVPVHTPLTPGYFGTRP
jgi:hypothetical protein